MENFRSLSIRETSSGPTSMHDLRSYSTSHASSYAQPQQQQQKDTDVKSKKGKGDFGASKSWNFKDPEAKRKKRVAGYNVYAVEGKMKGSLKKSFKWIKDTCAHVVHGWS